MREVDRSEMSDVWCSHLRVEQTITALAQSFNQRDQRDLRSRRHSAEHRFAKKGRFQSHAVQSADDPVIAPDLDRMGESAAMQFQVDRNHFVAQPDLFGVNLVVTSASPDDAREIDIEPDL